jgi:hypothetical protein
VDTRLLCGCEGLKTGGLDAHAEPARGDGHRLLRQLYGIEREIKELSAEELLRE